MNEFIAATSRKSAISAGALLLSASAAFAGCLSLNNDGGHEYFYNGCGVGVSVVWKDENYCRSTTSAKFPCSNYVARGDSSTMMTEGYVTWQYCESPGGSGDVLAVEDGWGNVVCKD